MTTKKTSTQHGTDLIVAERLRQTLEGYTAALDDEQTNNELAKAAVSYLLVVARPDEWAESTESDPNPPDDWPWDLAFWDPSVDPIRNLVKAGALIAAEIDRLQRLAGTAP